MNLLRSSPTSSFLASLFCLLLAICIASDRCIAQSGDSGRFGIRAYSSSVEVMLDGRLRSIPGKQISAVQSGGVADDAGVLVGDVIVKWDGSYVDGSLPFEILLRRSYGRGRVPFKVVRNATFISLTAEFGTAHEMVRHSRTSPGTTFGQENETTRLEREATRQSKVPAPLPYVGECVSGYKDVPFGAYLDEAKKLLLQANVCIDFSENGRILRPQSNDVIYCEPGYVLNGKQRRTKLYFSEGRVQRIELMMVEDGGGVDLDPYEALVALLTKKYGPAKMSENAIGETTWLFCNGEVALARTFPHLQIKAKKKLAMTMPLSFIDPSVFS